MTDDKKEPWTQYWRESHAHACTSEFSADARNLIQAAWARAFAAVKNDARILDIATGNGALIAHIAPNLVPDITHIEATGVDLARIEQSAKKHLQIDPRVAVQFIGGVDASTLPFEQMHFDLVVSQYGIEYGDLPLAFREACRVTKGHLMFLVHARNGEIVRQNAAICAQIDLLVTELCIIDHLKNYHQTPCDDTDKEMDDTLKKLETAIKSTEKPQFFANSAVSHQTDCQ